MTRHTLYLYADDHPIPLKGRIVFKSYVFTHLMGGHISILLLFEPPEDLAETLENCREILLETGEDHTLLARGSSVTLHERRIGGQKITMISFSDSPDALWDSVSVTIPAGTGLKDAILKVAGAGPDPVTVAALPETGLTLPRVRSFYGPIGGFFEEAADATNHYAFIYQGAVYFSPKKPTGKDLPGEEIPPERVFYDDHGYRIHLPVCFRVPGSRFRCGMDAYRVQVQVTNIDTGTGIWDTCFHCRREEGFYDV